MDNELNIFIQKARAKNLTTEQIRSKLLAAGWNQETVDASLADDLIAPSPPAGQRSSDAPSPLTKREETVRLKMFEYNIMFLTLWIVAIAMFWIINAFLFTSDSSVIVFPLTALLVCLPVFLVLFFSVRRHEAKDPELKHVGGRLHLVQSSQSISFVILLLHTIFALYQILKGSNSVGQQLMSWLGSVVIFGGIFVYYWQDTHKASSLR